MDWASSETDRVGDHLLGEVQILCYRLRSVAYSYSSWTTHARGASPGGHDVHARGAEGGEDSAGTGCEEDGLAAAAFACQSVAASQPGWAREYHPEAQAETASHPVPEPACGIPVARA